MAIFILSVDNRLLKDYSHHESINCNQCHIAPHRPIIYQ